MVIMDDWPVPIDILRVNHPGVRLSVLRLDAMDRVISGNKWFKLSLNLEAARAGKHSAVLTFGGAWSNHLLATAAAAARCGLGSIGVVRGLHAVEQETATLRQCKDFGMELRFISRAAYADKEDPDFLQRLADETGNPYIIPEGGANEAGRAGAGRIATHIPQSYTHICVSVGTGTTLAGLREALPVAQQITGFAPMKGGEYLAEPVAGWLSSSRNHNWMITARYHFGGFGKMADPLPDFMNSFQAQQGISLDRVYTAKMMYGVYDMLQEEYFPGGSDILCIHTGGLQGNRSLQ